MAIERGIEYDLFLARREPLETDAKVQAPAVLESDARHIKWTGFMCESSSIQRAAGGFRWK